VLNLFIAYLLTSLIYTGLDESNLSFSVSEDPTKFTTIDGINFITDSDVQFQGSRYVIMEVKKNEIGSKGAEPHAQAISYYIHATKSSVTRTPASKLPCILITLFGKSSAPYN